MDILFALIMMVIGMGVVYTFLYILVWVMRGLKFFEKIPGFREARPVEGQVDDHDEGLIVRPVRTGQAVGVEGDEKEVVAAAVSAYMMLKNREQGGPGPAGHPKSDLRKVTI